MSVNLHRYPTSPEGRPVTAPTFEDTNELQPKWIGHLYTATAGSTNIYDEAVASQQHLRGGWYEVMDDNAVLNDYVEFAVVDKDDVLGLFSAYGLTVGSDVLELQKYIVKEYINPNQKGRQNFIANSVWEIYQGLYLRTIYESTGANDVAFKVVTLAYE